MDAASSAWAAPAPMHVVDKPDAIRSAAAKRTERHGAFKGVLDWLFKR
ncbi:MAG: hypothetical protein OJF48_003060 [Afipia sp.]|nr:MAG: hypothetical protein OJF48_003060 [Afipia sp.]